MPTVAHRWMFVVLWALCGVGVLAQAPAPEVWAKDMREEVLRTPVTVTNMFGRQETRSMPVTVFRPAGDGPHPLLVLNHGRAGGDKRAAQGRARFENTARYLVGKGFVVMVPTRIGYWETYGDFDPEEYGSCSRPNYGPRHKAVVDQVLATVALAKTLPFVDASRWVVAGVSVGGVTAVATVGRNPPGLVGGINFSGGSGGNPDATPGRPCRPDILGKEWEILAKTATAPMLWLYWQNDLYWGEEVPQQWHQAWVGAGAKADFKSMAAIATDGHFGMDRDMDHWLPLVDVFLNDLGFKQPAIVLRPAATRWAEVKDVSKVPLSAKSRTAGYDKFLAAEGPKAFAIGTQGGWGYATGDYVTGRALGFCQRSGQTCKLYAVDDQVVWTGQ